VVVLSTRKKVVSGRNIEERECLEFCAKCKPKSDDPPTPGTALKRKQGVFHTVALPFTLKSILRQKKNYENSNISPCKNIIFKKIL
jgi:hypothetical protein